MNHPTASKINWTTTVSGAIQLVVAFDIVPLEAEQPLLILSGAFLAPLVIAFRTWFTGNKDG